MPRIRAEQTVERRVVEIVEPNYGAPKDRHINWRIMSPAFRIFHTCRPPHWRTISALVHLCAPLDGRVFRRVISSDLVGQRRRAMYDVDMMAQIR